ncbi:4-alpha-glucanotransferase [Aerococcus viridans]
MERASGVVLHISSLPNQFGIGSFGASAYEFVDFLVKTKQQYWQILPLTTTSYGDSPYQSFSAFAGNTHFIDFDLLAKQGYLDKTDYQKVNFGDDPKKVAYNTIFQKRRPILEKAVANFVQAKANNDKEFLQFYEENQFWLVPFAQYMTVKEEQGQNPWYEWPTNLRNYDEAVVTQFCEAHIERYEYHLVTQFWFNQQYKALKEYANDNHIEIIGDIPIYVARDSVEMWTQPELFLTDEKNNPSLVAGVPPDFYSADGQYWGNPIYDWDYMEETDYAWWILRMKESFKLYDVVRIDHFRGFESYWAVPFGSPTAASGSWQKGPGNKIFDQFKKELGDIKVIAEDLGFMTQAVNDMRDQTGYPGMKVLQNGFYGKDSEDLPHHYPVNSVAYASTHDSMQAYDWYMNQASQADRDQADQYLNRGVGEHPSDAFVRGIAASPSRLAIYMMNDLLRLGPEGRINIPSTIGGNWDWRVRQEDFTVDLEERLRSVTETYFRVNQAFVSQDDQNNGTNSIAAEAAFLPEDND